MRWIVYAAVFSILANLAVTIYALFFLQERTAGLVVTFVTILGFGVALPLSFGIAILRYRLYDLDLFLNRTIVYGAVTGVLLVAIGVVDVLAQRAMVAWFNQTLRFPAAGAGTGGRARLQTDAARGPAAGRPGPAGSRAPDVAVHGHRGVDAGDRGSGRRAVARGAGPVSGDGAPRAGATSGSRGEHGRRRLLRGVRPAGERSASAPWPCGMA